MVDEVNAPKIKLRILRMAGPYWKWLLLIYALTELLRELLSQRVRLTIRTQLLPVIFEMFSKYIFSNKPVPPELNAKVHSILSANGPICFSYSVYIAAVGGLGLLTALAVGVFTYRRSREEIRNAAVALVARYQKSPFSLLNLRSAETRAPLLLGFRALIPLAVVYAVIHACGVTAKQGIDVLRADGTCEAFFEEMKPHWISEDSGNSSARSGFVGVPGRF